MKPCKHWFVSNGSRRAQGSSFTTMLIGTELVTRYGLKVLIIHQDKQGEGIEYFIRASVRSERNQEQNSQLSVPDGWSEYKRLVRNGLLDVPMFVSCTSPIIPGLDVLRAHNRTDASKEETHREQNITDNDVLTLMKISEMAYDVVLWDWNCRAPKRDDESDGVNVDSSVQHQPYNAGTVILISQDLRDVEYWSNPVNRIGSRAFEPIMMGVVTCYDPQAHLNISNMKKQLRGMSLYAVPYDAQLRHHANEGHLVHYILQQQYRKERGHASKLLDYVDRLAEHILSESVLPNRRASVGGRRWNG